jgi:hypothetical protein
VILRVLQEVGVAGVAWASRGEDGPSLVQVAQAQCLLALTEKRKVGLVGLEGCFLKTL